MDDIRDYEEDREKGEENVVIDLGGGVEGFEKTFELFRKNCETLSELNPTLANFLLTYEEGSEGENSRKNVEYGIG